MRDYAKVSPAFWMTGSGKLLRGCPEAQIVGLYLVTCPSANMIGLYYLPKALLIHETGLSAEGASEGLRRASQAGFAFYDEDAELVWVPNAATYQIGDTLTGKDKRKEGVIRELSVHRKHRFSREFFAKYAEVYELPKPEWLASPLDAPSEVLRSQEQEQEQDLSPPLSDLKIGDPEIAGSNPAEPEPTPVERDPSRAPWSLPSGFVLMNRAGWVAAYERGVASALGLPRWAFPMKAVSGLTKVVETYCLEPDRKDIDRWIERDVAAFVRAVVALDENPDRAWNSYGPDGWQKWHNRECPGLPREPRRSAPVAVDPLEKPSMTPEQTADRDKTISDMLATFGTGGPRPANGLRKSRTPAEAPTVVPTDLDASPVNLVSLPANGAHGR